MKKIFLSIFSALALLMTACDNGSYEVHQTFFYPQRPGGMVLYADQETDTVRLYSLDPWKASTQQSWLTVTPSETPLTNGEMSLSTLLTVTAGVNDTGARRVGGVEVKSYDYVTMPVAQNAWLNIVNPSPRYDTADGQLTATLEADKVKFTLNAKADADTTVTFVVYQDGATLQSGADWMTPETTAFEAGRHVVRLSLDRNDTGAPRIAVLTLTSGGVSTPVEVIQAAQR